MFVIEKYNDGSVSYAYETGDRVVVQRQINLYSLHGHLIQTYNLGDIVTITGRRSNAKSVIPGLIEFYQFNHHFDSQLGSAFKPEKPELALPKPKAYVVHWYEWLDSTPKSKRIKKCGKYSLVAARNEEEATTRCFSAKYFTPERMKNIEVGQVFEKLNWDLPSGERWISIHHLL